MTDIFNLAGKVALITGGNGGIGLGMARGLASKGADIAIWGTNADKNRAARAEIEAMGVRVADFICDVGDQAQVEASFAATLEALGRVDSCFVNAGVGGQAESFVSMTDDEWHRVLRVNLDGAFYTAQVAVRSMVAAGTGGSVVFTTSGSAYFGQQRGQHYGASKAGVINLTQSMADELSEFNINVNAIIPGTMDTPRNRKDMPKADFKKWVKPEDIAEVIAFLCSNKGDKISGAILPVYGKT